MRSGAKHGLLPGSWVMGVFADGNEANDGYAFCTFNFTAKASEENNRTDVDVSGGRLPDDIRGFTKINPIIEGIYPNIGLNTKEELTSGKDDSGDIAHDASAMDDSSDGTCPIKKSAASTLNAEPKTGENPGSQLYSTELADGLCGTLVNGRDLVSDLIKEKLPTGLTRYVDTATDVVYDLYGNQINLNGILRIIATEISSILKETIQTQKGFIQKTINKISHSSGLLSASTRSPLTAQLADVALSTSFDIFNSVIDRSLDTLTETILQSLVNINNQQKSSKGATNNTGELRTSRSSLISDLNPIYIADAVLNDAEINFQNVKGAAEVSIEKSSAKVSGELTAFDTMLSGMVESDFETRDDMDESIGGAYASVQASIGDITLEVSADLKESMGMDLDFGVGVGFGGGNFDLGKAAEFLSLALNMDFTLTPTVFNKAGLAVLDIFTSGGCNPFAMYNTVSGLVGNTSGSSGSREGGGSESGKSSKRFEETYLSAGFGGRPGFANENETTDKKFPEDVNRSKIRQRRRREINSNLRRWRRVDYYEPTRSYELRGEQVINGETTDRSRVLVNNQEDPSDNGIYITSTREWRRAPDAELPTDFSKRRIVLVNSLPEGEDKFYYSGKKNPKVSFDEITFRNVNDSEEFSDEEKQALDPTVDIEPDGSNATVFLTSLPSSDEEAAKNFINGVPNTPIIRNSGGGYFFESKKAGRNFPSVVIQDYFGTPVPVVDRKSGEIVTVLVNQLSFNTRANPSVSIIPDDSSIGIVSDDSNYDIFISQFYVQNSGIGYDKDTKITIIDKDKEVTSAIAKPKVVDGRIVSVEVINNGSGFLRMPRVKIKGSGRKAKIYPIMGLKAKTSDPSVKKLQETVNLALSPVTGATLSTTLNVNS